MTKAELIAKMTKDAAISKGAAEKAMNSFISNVSDGLKKGEKITLIGFGTFSIANRKARKGRNPQTGEEINIKARKVVKFKPGTGLQDSVEK